MALNQIGQNAVEEFFEELLYATAYNEARQQVSNITKDVDNEVVREALESALNVVVMGVVFLILQKQEQYIERVFNWVMDVVIPLIVTSRTKILGKLRRYKGIKLLKRLDFLTKTDNVDVAKVVVDAGRFHLQTHQTSSQTTKIMDHVINQKQYLIDKERFHLEGGKAFTDRYYQGLLFKLFTRNFTPNDRLVLKKILGKTDNVDVDDLNKVADFMFVKDSNGNLIGLSEAFVELLNGLGYVRR